MATEERRLGEKYKRAVDYVGSAESACPVCTKRNRTCATKFCIDCEDSFCSTCVEAQEAGIDHSSHIVTDISTDKEDDNTCEEHPAEPITSFCNQHDVLCCCQCLQGDHGACTVTNISESCQELCDSDKKLEIVAKLKSVKEQIIKTIRAHSNVKETLSEEKERVVKEIRDARSCIEQTLKDLEKSTIEHLSANCDLVEAQFKENADTAGRILSSIMEFERKLESLNSSTADTFINLKLAERQIHLTQPSCEVSLKPGVKTIQFKENAKISTLLQEIEELGTCNFIPYPLQKSTTSDSKEQTYTGTVPLTIVCSGQIKCDLKVQDDEETCDVTGICVTPDGTVVCVDYTNKKLKRLEKTSYKVLDFLDLPENPLDICAVSNDEAIISMGQTIHFVSLGTKMELTRSLTFNHDCQFLSYHESKIYVSDGSEEIHMYSMYGTLLSEISTDLSVSGFACSKDGNKLYIADENEPCLAAVDIHGVLIWKLSAEEMEMAGVDGVCVDGFGNILVCGRGRDESDDLVACVTGCGEYSGGWSGGFDHYYIPTCVCFDKNSSKLIVASNCGRELLINSLC